MTLIVETGAVVAGANSYNTLQECDDYFEALNDLVWVNASDENKEAALIKAAYYMQARYRLRWAGSRVSANQSLDWPRTGVPVPDFFNPFYRNLNAPLAFADTYFIGTGEIPRIVKQVQAILARYTMDAAGISNGVLQGALGRATKSETVGSLSVTYMGSGDGVPVRETTYYWEAENLLQPFLRPATMSGRVVRC